MRDVKKKEQMNNKKKEQMNKIRIIPHNLFQYSNSY